jgi:hypothetical protein
MISKLTTRLEELKVSFEHASAGVRAVTEHTEIFKAALESRSSFHDCIVSLEGHVKNFLQGLRRQAARDVPCALP